MVLDSWTLRPELVAEYANKMIRNQVYLIEVILPIRFLRVADRLKPCSTRIMK
jgi:hypothetical protein